ncbi:hypothetical protein HOE37_05775 [Candidatus Woesearchaeota archaeon]|jgi:ketopantoate reductase|nr:hypothetical protein [Candidatus Woesearchaeota archaeon]MBT4111342.1 hypothetical protein [Candidatus Woesearchaeota archaeon]MBT4336479.1 hypothetical protein [Candidatus Woesearchaeota archaeon]MBT4469892.1 hypothetical protein [Candidatus Woesearchaeota archaeon]MBT6744437.1 hypothetical protein [Candidatus Woesearchaeota archaeon]
MTTLDAIVIGSGPVATLNAVSLDPSLTIGWTVFKDKTAKLKQGVHLVNGKKVKEGLEEELYERVIESSEMVFDPKQPEEGKLNIYTVQPNQQLSLDTLPITDETLIVLATKSYSNEDVLEQLKPLLDVANPTIVLTQNGVAPEIRVNEWLEKEGYDKVKVVRGVALGPCTYDKDDPTILNNNIHDLVFGHWNAENHEGHEEATTTVVEAYTHLPTKSGGNNFKGTSISKALVNLINPISILFANSIGEALESSLISNLYLSCFEEGLAVFKDQGITLEPRNTLDSSLFMYDAARPHMPSMGRDTFVAIQGGEDYQFPLETETIDLSGQIAVLGKEAGITTYWNSLCADLVDDFCKSFNEIKEQGGSDIAAEFAVRFVTRNRHIAGLDPYQLHNRARDFDVVEDLQEGVKKRFAEVDTNLPKAVYLCPSLASPNTSLPNLSQSLINSYQQLKLGYSQHLSQSNVQFDLQIAECPNTEVCSKRKTISPVCLRPT